MTYSPSTIALKGGVTLMPRRGENIYKRKDGRWEGRYIKGHSYGKTQYGYVYAKTYSEVKQKLSDLKKLSDLLVSSEETLKTGNDNLSFGVISSEWLHTIRPQIKESSYIKYTNSLNSYLNPVFSSMEIEEISRTDISTFCIELSQEGGVHKKGLSAKTITDTLSILWSVFDYAANEKGLMVANISGISVKASHTTMRVLSVAEQEKLETLLREDLNPCNLGILLCLYTGLRIGELCALTWNDISDSEQILFVNKTMQRLQQLDGGEKKTKVVISTPKSECSIRQIPLPDSIYQILKSNRKNNDAYILTGISGKYLEPRTMENRFKKILSKTMIEDTNFHALRHTFATRCIELGFDIKSLSEILGHASVNITLNRYVHPSMELKQKNMNMLSGLFAVK